MAPHRGAKNDFPHSLIAGPGLTTVLDAAGATSPDGRSRSFDASADGYGRGEGCGVLVLKRLANADRDGDRVLAVIRGSAVNQNGRTNGIMAPNGEAQEIEVAALGKVYGRAGADGPCLLSSVKSNIGHLEAGAGVAGMMKTVLAPDARRDTADRQPQQSQSEHRLGQ